MIFTANGRDPIIAIYMMMRWHRPVSLAVSQRAIEMRWDNKVMIMTLQRDHLDGKKKKKADADDDDEEGGDGVGAALVLPKQ